MEIVSTTILETVLILLSIVYTGMKIRDRRKRRDDE